MKPIAAGAISPDADHAGPALMFLAAAALAGCSGHHPQPAPSPRANAGRSAGIMLSDDWRARVVVDRDDSIILTLPSGDHQLQRYSRRASFLMKISDGGDVTITLDSLVVKPGAGADAGNPVGAVWTGEVAGDRLNGLQLRGHGSASAAPLTTMVRELLPRLPRSGARPGLSWADTSEGPVQVDIFSGSERRTARWSAGPMAGRDRLLPVSVRQEFEQLGSGSEGGRKMSMTSQGRSSGVYYIEADGRITDAQINDSVAMLISIPGTRQLIPTTRYSRTSMHFFSPMRGQSD